MIGYSGGIQGIGKGVFVWRYDFNLFIYLFNNLFKVDKFTKIQYTYIHKSSRTNWLNLVILISTGTSSQILRARWDNVSEPKVTDFIDLK